MSIYKTNPLVGALTGVPINRVAYRVADQRNVSKVYPTSTMEELKFALERLSRKQVLMKKLLGVKNPSHHANIVKRYNLGQFQKLAPRRLIAEYVRNGLAIKLLVDRIAELHRLKDPSKYDRQQRALRQEVGRIEQVWRDAHPGCLWTGDQLVAPNGDIFDRNGLIKKLKETA